MEMPRSRSISIQSLTAWARARWLDGAGELDRASVKEELFGQRRLSRIGMGDDGERLSALDLAVKLSVGHGAREDSRISRSGWPSQ